MSKEIKSVRTAIRRNKPSRPCKDLYENTIHMPSDCTILDYECGKGDDVLFLKEKGYNVIGYDPAYHQGMPDIQDKYDLVMCNYVLCAISNKDERNITIINMWDRVIANGCLSISVRSKDEIDKAQNSKWQSYKDGWITENYTFQKGFTEDDLIKLVIDLPNIAYIETDTNNKDIITVRVIKKHGIIYG